MHRVRVDGADIGDPARETRDDQLIVGFEGFARALDSGGRAEFVDAHDIGNDLALACDMDKPPG